MITPEDIVKIDFDRVDFNEIEKQIDESINSYHGWHTNCEHAILDQEYPLTVRNHIAQQYRNAGWTYVYHATTSELGERGGLTSFYFSTNPLSDTLVKNYFKI